MRWHILVPMTLIAGLVQMLIGGNLRFPTELAQAEIMLLVAFHCALSCRQSYVLPAFWWCGLARDAFLGGHLGMSAILYSVCAVTMTFFRKNIFHDNIPVQTGSVLIITFMLCIVRPLIDYAQIPPAPELFGDAAVNALFTAALCPVVWWLFKNTRLKPWREVKADYGIARV